MSTRRSIAVLLVLVSAVGCATQRPSRELRDELRTPQPTTAPTTTRATLHAHDRPDTTPTATAPTTRSLATSVPDTPPRFLFPKKDEEILARYGIHWVPTGEGFLVRHAPVDCIGFPQDPALSEDDIAALFPTFQRMDPYRLEVSLVSVTDRTVELLNRLRSVREIHLARSGVTMEGLRKLRLKPGKTLTVPPTISEAERRELAELMPGVTIR